MTDGPCSDLVSGSQMQPTVLVAPCEVVKREG